MTAHSTDILWLKNINKQDSFTSGDKAVLLGNLLQDGFPLPDGFVVTSVAYFHFLHKNNLIPKITSIISCFLLCVTGSIVIITPECSPVIIFWIMSAIPSWK